MCIIFRAPWLRHAIFFLGDVWAHHSAFCHFSWGSNKCISDTSAVKMGWTNALPSFLLHGQWVVLRTNNTHCYWVSLSTCGIHFPFFFFLIPQAVGKDLVNTCWRDSVFCSNCHAWNTARAFKDVSLVPCGIHLSQVSGSAASGIVCLFFPAKLNGIHPSADSFVWRSVCP